MAIDAPAPTRRSARWVRVPVFAISVGLVGLGVGLMIEAALGVSPNDVTNTGLAERTGWSVGVCAWTLASVVTVIAWALGRHATLATVLSSVGVGLGIDAALRVLPSPDALLPRVGFLALGLGVIWIAITGIVATDVGIGPIELLMLALTDRGLELHVARWGIEVVLLGAGWVLGGSVGVGTATFALATGPVLAVTIPWAVGVLGTDLSRPSEIAAAGP